MQAIYINWYLKLINWWKKEYINSNALTHDLKIQVACASMITICYSTKQKFL